jgi:hypothetical protein
LIDGWVFEDDAFIGIEEVECRGCGEVIEFAVFDVAEVVSDKPC